MMLSVQRKSIGDMGLMLGIDLLFSVSFKLLKIGMVGKTTAKEQIQKTG